MKTLLILTLDLPEPEDITKVLDHIDCPTVPYFAGNARITVEPVSTAIENWLDQ